MDPKVELIEEDPNVKTPEEQLKYYGQDDHKRVFGMHADQFLNEARFTVESIKGEDYPEEILPVMECKKHQDMVNYLVHLEDVAALVNNGVLRISAVNDLMAYRFFIAVNNSLVQDEELLEDKEYYQGCIKAYKIWKKYREDMRLVIPLEKCDLEDVL